MNIINSLSSIRTNIKNFKLLILFSNVSLFLVVKASDIDVQKDRVKLSQLKIITLHKDNYTNSRRLDPILQLKCMSTPALCRSYAPSFVKCVNRGYPEDKIKWECSAELDKKIRFGRLKVICEGYDNASDDFILDGSCGLEYYLEFANFNQVYDYYNKDIYETSKISNFLTLMIMVIVVLTVYKSCIKNRQLATRRDLNETYAQIISDGSDQNLSPTIFPPPPPSYSFAIQNASKSDENSDKTETNSRHNTETRGSENFISGSSVASLGQIVNTSNLLRHCESPPPAYQNSNDTYTCTAYAENSRR